MKIVFYLYRKFTSLWIRLTIKIKKRYYCYRVKVVAKSVGKDLRVNSRSSVSSNTILGDNVNFNGMNIIGYGKVSIGNNFHSGPGCMIMNSYHNYDNGITIPYDFTYIHKDVTIGDNVWLGSNVTILGGVTIGEGAIIQIGSVVVSNIPPLAIAGGHPAKVYKYRDKEHYWSLKEQGKFH